MSKAEHAGRKRARDMLNRAGYNAGGHVARKLAGAEAVAAHEEHLHPGKPQTFKRGGRVGGKAGHKNLAHKARGGGISEASMAKTFPPKKLNKEATTVNNYARGGRAKGSKHGINIVIGTPGNGAGAAGAAGPGGAMAQQAGQQQAFKAGVAAGAGAAQKAAMGQTGAPPPGAGPGGPPPGGPMPGGPMGAKPPMPMPPPGAAPGGMPMKPPGMKRGGRTSDASGKFDAGDEDEMKRGGRTKKKADGGAAVNPSGRITQQEEQFLENSMPDEGGEKSAPTTEKPSGHASGGRANGGGLSLTKKMGGSAANGIGRLVKSEHYKHKFKQPA